MTQEEKKLRKDQLKEMKKVKKELKQAFKLGLDSSTKATIKKSNAQTSSDAMRGISILKVA